MLSRRDVYGKGTGTSLNRLRFMSPYNIELNSRNLGLKTQGSEEVSLSVCYDVTVLLLQRQLQRAQTNAKNKMPIQSIYLEDFRWTLSSIL